MSQSARQTVARFMARRKAELPVRHPLPFVWQMSFVFDEGWERRCRAHVELGFESREAAAEWFDAAGPGTNLLPSLRHVEHIRPPAPPGFGRQDHTT